MRNPERDSKLFRLDPLYSMVFRGLGGVFAGTGTSNSPDFAKIHSCLHIFTYPMYVVCSTLIYLLKRSFQLFLKALYDVMMR